MQITGPYMALILLPAEDCLPLGFAYTHPSSLWPLMTVCTFIACIWALWVLPPFLHKSRQYCTYVEFEFEWAVWGGWGESKVKLSPLY